MTNKKLLAVASLAAVISTSSAFAKTEGNYVGLDILRTNIESKDAYNEKNYEEGYGVGVNYKYALNFNGFFVAPVLFYNFNNTDTTFGDVSGDTYSRDLKYSYGIKLDAGYDFTDKFAAYLTVGHSENRLKANSSFDEKENSTQEAFLYGAGVKYSVSDNIDLNAAYEISQFGKSREVFHEGDDSFNSDYHLIRVGASYKF